MARMSSGPGLGSSSNNPNSRDAFASFYQTYKDSLEQQNQVESASLAHRVINSQAYKDAYALFVNLTDQRWLQRLVAIPYSVSDPGRTLLDDLGLSSSYDDKVAANYNACMTEIAKLVEQYQQYVQGLPETQANQLSVIGSNSAITGANLQGSQLNPMDHSTPQAMQSSDASSFITGAANFLLSATNGFADLALKFKDLGLRKVRQSFDIAKESASFIKDINTYARDHGITFNHEIRTLDDFDNLVIHDSGKTQIQLKQLLNAAVDDEYYSPLISHLLLTNQGSHVLAPTDYIAGDKYGAQQIGGETGVYIDHDRYLGLDAVVNAQLELHKLERGNSIMRKYYETEMLKYGADSAEYKSLYDKQQFDISEYQKRRNKIANDLISALSKSNRPEDKLLLSKILLQYNANDIKLQETATEWSDWNAFFGGVGNAAGAAASLVPLL